MKAPHALLAAVMAALPLVPAESLHAVEPPAKQVRAALDACPAPVRESIAKAATKGTVTKVRAVRRGDQTFYIADIRHDSDEELKIHLRADGTVARRTEKLTPDSAPAPVRAALRALAGPDGEIGGLKKVTENDVVVFKAELNRIGRPDLDVTVAADGKVLERKEDDGD